MESGSQFAFARGMTSHQANDDANFATTPNILKHYGYPLEVHHVTSDNYILELHRIPRGIQSTYRKTTPVLLHHGLATSSADFILNQPNQSIAYLLADRGYDVWMANLRGNCYSRSNNNLSTQDPQFWDFSLDDIIEKDLPALIDYVLEISCSSQLYYVGHSLGTTICFGLLSLSVYYNAKVKAFFVLGPGVHISKSRGILRKILPFLTWNRNYVNGEMFPKDSLTSRIMISIMQSPFAFIAEKFIQSAFGDKVGTLDKTKMPIYLKHIPNGISKRVLHHVEQIVRKESFRKYDWGIEKNAKFYNQVEPPSYNLSKVTAPTYIFYTWNDTLTIEGVKMTANEVGNLKGLYQVGSQDNGHLWFLLGTDAAAEYYNIIFDIMDETP